MMIIALTIILETIEGHIGPVQNGSGEERRGNKRIAANTKRGDNMLLTIMFFNNHVVNDHDSSVIREAEEEKTETFRTQFLDIDIFCCKKSNFDVRC